MQDRRDTVGWVLEGLVRELLREPAHRPEDMRGLGIRPDVLLRKMERVGVVAGEVKAGDSNHATRVETDFQLRKYLELAVFPFGSVFYFLARYKNGKKRRKRDGKRRTQLTLCPERNVPRFLLENIHHLFVFEARVLEVLLDAEMFLSDKSVHGHPGVRTLDFWDRDLLEITNGNGIVRRAGLEGEWRIVETTVNQDVSVARPDGSLWLGKEPVSLEVVSLVPVELVSPLARHYPTLFGGGVRSLD